MSNSKLISYTNISPNKNSPRNHKIDSIAIHCMAGHLSLQTCGNLFQNVEASSNYGIDDNGDIGLFVDECDRSWATSSPYVDNRAITIEVANDNFGSGQCTVKALNSLIDLCVDICKRNGIKKMHWFGNRYDSENFNRKDGDGVFFVHRWYAQKSCPNDYLYEKHQYICDEVNKRLNDKAENQPQQEIKPQTKCDNATVELGYQHALNFCGMRSKGAVLQEALNMDYGCGLDVDGVIGNNTKSALGSHYVQKGETQYMVTALEILLMINGYDPKGVECAGVFGSGLEACVKQFQKDKGLTVDGVAGRNTFLELVK